MNVKYFFFTLCSIIILLSCKDDVLPKPSAMLRLEYPEPNFKNFSTACPYEFKINEMAKVVDKKGCSYNIDYPKMKASIFITYKKIDGNLEDLLKDAQKLTYDHVVKAANIIEQPFVNEGDKVYGMFYQVSGNAASQSQFYATDSLNHFLAGSLYFYAKPNYDSILPAADYIENDIRKMIESLKWK